MARTARKKSSSNFYHIMIRGVNKQDIFHDDQDRRYFIHVLRKILENDETELIIYCLMRNHVHLLIHSRDPGAFFKRVASAYVYYFNRKYKRVGHLFQDRFKSEPVDDERYLLTVFRYILRNPEAAGICRTNEYPWSGCGEIEGQKDICTLDLLLRLVGTGRELKAFVLSDNEDECMDLEEKDRPDDREAAELIKRIAQIEKPEYLRMFRGEKRDEIIRRLLLAGVTPRQLSEAAHISRDTVRKARRSVSGDREGPKVCPR